MVSDGQGQPLSFFLSPREMSDTKDALVLVAQLLTATRPLGDKGHDAEWLRDDLKAKALHVCIPGRRGRLHPARHDRRLYKKRCRIENAFARLEDWRAMAMPYTRCGDPFLFALAAAVTC